MFAVIAQTTRFRAAIERTGFADVLANYSQFRADGSAHYAMAIFEENRSLGGTPWTAQDNYLKNSPLWAFDRISTPVLMIHGTDDTSVYVHNGDQSFACLRRLGKVAEYLRYAGEPHGFLLRANCVDSATRTLEFLDHHLDIERDQQGAILWDQGRAASRRSAALGR